MMVTETLATGSNHKINKEEKHYLRKVKDALLVSNSYLSMPESQRPLVQYRTTGWDQDGGKRFFLDAWYISGRGYFVKLHPSLDK
jgi:hypothetical protein